MALPQKRKYSGDASRGGPPKKKVMMKTDDDEKTELKRYLSNITLGITDSKKMSILLQSIRKADLSLFNYKDITEMRTFFNDMKKKKGTNTKLLHLMMADEKRPYLQKATRECIELLKSVEIAENAKTYSAKLKKTIHRLRFRAKAPNGFKFDVGFVSELNTVDGALRIKDKNAFKIKGQVARRTYAATFLEKEVFVYKDQDCSNLRLIVRFSKEEHLGTIILGVTESQGDACHIILPPEYTGWVLESNIKRLPKQVEEHIVSEEYSFEQFVACKQFGNVNLQEFLMIVVRITASNLA